VREHARYAKALQAARSLFHRPLLRPLYRTPLLPQFRLLDPIPPLLPRCEGGRVGMTETGLEEESGRGR